ncbi:MAG: LacI family DNA-binding transcriptional regulator, partial [Ferruginibacter sp.]
MNKKISIHDIARHLNVSATTVSFVLNGKAEERKISN